MTAARSFDVVGADGNRLAGEIRDGGGPPVIFLHGGGQTRHAWKTSAQRFAARGMRAIAFDLRGHGDSEWVEGGRYGFGDFAADVAAMTAEVERRFGERPSLVGASLGGLAALLSLVRGTAACTRFVLVDVTPRMDPQGVAKVRGFMGAHAREGFGTLEEASLAISAYLPHRRKPRSLEGLKKNLRLGSDGRYRWHWDPAFLGGERHLDAMSEIMRRLPELDVPMLLVRGMQSELVQEEHAREFVALARDARYVDIDGASHMIAGDRNDVFSDAILPFLAAPQEA